MNKEQSGLCNVIQMASLGKDFDERLAQQCRVLQWWSADIPSETMLKIASRATVAVTSVRRGFDCADFERMPSLKAICSWGVGYETLDVATAIERRVYISNTPGILDDCVADHAWALLLATARQTAVADCYVKNGHWKTIGSFPLATKVTGKRLGILGLGRIGDAIARRGTGFDMDVRYFSRRPVSGTKFGHEPSLSSLAAWSDFLVIACPGGPSTYHLVDMEILQALGPEGILINIARGSIVNEKALEAALLAGEIRGAGLDVLEHEPAIPEIFATMDRVTLTPHIGSATRDTRKAMEQLVLDNVCSTLKTGQPLTIVPETKVD